MNSYLLLPLAILIACFNFLRATAQSASGVKTVTEISMDNKDKEITRSFKAYDPLGNLVEEKEYDDDGKLKDHVKYEYNAANQKVKETHYAADDEPVEITAYEYDAKGNRIAKTEMDGTGKVKSRKKYVYEFY